MPLIYSFPPIADQHAKILILGSIPGQASLTANQYYAHQRNAFWPIMSRLLEFDINATYQQKVQALRTAKIALWDVLQSCQRQGSLDAKIKLDTQIPNDFQTFFNSHPEIRHIFFNGGKAASSFQRDVAPNLDLNTFQLARLPSTSPAHATLSLEQKLTAWRQILVI